jgi:hypothetical protein
MCISPAASDLMLDERPRAVPPAPHRIHPIPKATRSLIAVHASWFVRIRRHAALRMLYGVTAATIDVNARGSFWAMLP